jgi:sn-glycerol 3-phosphate transport system ATP-binding protein
VTGVEYLGADSIVTCVAGSESLAARVQGRAALVPGASVRLCWPEGALHVFDAATGRRRR